MCVPGIGAGLFSALGGGAATAAGATAAATGIGSTLATIGTGLAVVGPIVQGFQTASAMRAQSAEIERQKQEEQRLNAAKENRAATQFQRQIADMYGQLAARGVDTDSPSAVFLGETAAREMSFEAQSIRSTGESRQRELTSSQRLLSARARQSMFNGLWSGAGSLAKAAPKLWPELLS